MGLPDITAPAVNQAIDEFNQLKRKAFLKKYKFGPARGYLIEKDGRTYDSKAIAGAAHGYLPGQQPLTAKDFSGGEATVKMKLEELGFAFANPRRSPQDQSGLIRNIRSGFLTTAGASAVGDPNALQATQPIIALRTSTTTMNGMACQMPLLNTMRPV
jgi:hypothetical protein